MDPFIKTGKRRNSKETCDDYSATNSENSSPKPKFKKKNRVSDVWKYFKRAEDRKSAKCLNCHKEYKTSGNTSNLRDHLNRFHPNLKDEEQVPQVVDQDFAIDAFTFLTVDKIPFTSSSCRSSIRSIDSYTEGAVLYDPNAERKKLIDRALAEMIAIDVQPYSMVENTGFIKYSRIMDVRYKLPSRGHLKNVLMMDLFNETSAKLLTIFEGISNIAITCDLWTSRANVSFLSVTGHFVQDFSLKTASLATRKLADVTNHSAQNIANTLQEVLASWDLLKKTVCVVTNNVSCVVKACELLKIQSVPCFAHTLNLVLQDVLNFDDDATNKLILKCKTVFRVLSSNTGKKFKNAQEGFANSLLHETPSSFYLMIEKILTTQEEINAVLLSTTNAPLPFNAEEINVLRDMEKILSLFQQVSGKIAGGEAVTISLIIPLINGLYRKVKCISSQMETTSGIKMTTVLLESIVRRLCPYEKRTVTSMATILDPRFKKVGFQQNTNAEQAEICLERELGSLIHRENPDNLDFETTLTSRDSLLDFLEQRTTLTRGIARSDASNIKRQYLERSIVPQDMDPLLWIKVNQADFPSIKILMHKYFCIPATSVESERVFTKAGQIVSDRRMHLKEENVNILMFLNRNLWISSSTPS